MTADQYIPAKPTFHVKRSVFVQIVDSIPRGKLSTAEAIINYLADYYKVEQISIPDFTYNRLDEVVAGIEHPWWRLVSQRGLVQDIPHRPYGMNSCKQHLEEEGHTVILAASGVSYKVVNYKDALYDLNEIKQKLPSKEEAAYYGKNAFGL